MRRRTLLSALLTAGVLLCLTGLAMAQEGGGGEEGKVKTKYLEWFIIRGGFIAWLLIVINFASWALMIAHFFGIRRTTILPEPIRAQISEMIQAKRFKEVIEYTAGEASDLSYVIHHALAEAGHGYAAMERAMEEASEERTTTLLRKIELLNVVGNVAPMLGLLGTAYGMIKVFSGIVQAGGMPQPEQLAEGVGIALVTTFWGLIVAIPALAVYAFMRNRIDGLSSEVVMVSQGSISTFRPAPKKD